MKNGLTKNDSQAIKGIAILLLLFHHLFFNANELSAYTINFAPLEQDLVVNLAVMGKMCVSIFAFITGYGLLKSISKIDFNAKSVAKWNVTRLFKTMSGYWFIFIPALIITQLTYKIPERVYFTSIDPLYGIVNILNSFFGISNIVGTPNLLSTWWYMSAAIVFILLVPLIYRLAQKTGYFIVIALVIIVPRILKLGFLGDRNAISFILPVIFGMAFAQYSVFEKLDNMLNRKKFIAYPLALIIMGLLIYGSYFYYMGLSPRKAWEMDYGVIPLLYIIFFRFFIIRIPVLKNVLSYFGKYSMTIFLTHGFIRSIYLKEFIYTRGSSIMIFLTLTIISLALAVALDYIKKWTKFDTLTTKIANSINNKIDKAKA